MERMMFDILFQYALVAQVLKNNRLVIVPSVVLEKGSTTMRWKLVVILSKKKWRL